MSKVRIGIAGYGNLGKGVELAIRQNDDMELAGIFTRRDPSTLKPLTAGAPVFSMDDLKNKKNDFLSRLPSLQRTSTLSTALILTSVSPSTSQTLTRLPRRAVTLHSSHSVGIPVFSHSTDFMPSLSSPTARAIHSGARA